MKITKEMLHPELRPYSGQMRMMSLFFSARWSTRLANYIMCHHLEGKDEPGLRCGEVKIPSRDGSWKIRARTYQPLEHDGPLPILFYIHGGGYVMGNPEVSIDVIRRFIETRPCIVVAPDYRKSYTEPYPAGFDDCYDALLWAAAHADELGAIDGPIIVGGHSAGGGLTAAVTLKARDTKDVEIAFQMPIYPMIDHEQPSDPGREMDVVGWNTNTNRIGWNAYLSKLIANGSEIPAYASPALNDDYRDFPPTITLVGEYEPFYEETKTYVEGLRKAGVDVAFEEYPKCFHGFDMLAPDASIAKAAIEFTLTSYADFYDRYAIPDRGEAASREN